MKKSSEAPSCDWAPKAKRGKIPARGGAIRQRTRLMRHKGDFSWDSVRTERYKLDDGTWAGVLRRTLTGARGEATAFHLRYFEIAPGGHTTLERHRHEHVVVCVRGGGDCKVRGRRYALGFLDAIYIPPEAPHMLANPHQEPFGFLCAVDAERDRPRPVGRGGA